MNQCVLVWVMCVLHVRYILHEPHPTALRVASILAVPTTIVHAGLEWLLLWLMQ